MWHVELRHCRDDLLSDLQGHFKINTRDEKVATELIESSSSTKQRMTNATVSGDHHITRVVHAIVLKNIYCYISQGGDYAITSVCMSFVCVCTSRKKLCMDLMKFLSNRRSWPSLKVITRSHGSMTSVVKATPQVNVKRQSYPSRYTHTP